MAVTFIKVTEEEQIEKNSRDRRTHLARDLRLHQRRCVHGLHDRKNSSPSRHPPPDGKRGLRLLYDARRRRARGLYRPCCRTKKGKNVPEQALRFRRSSQPRPAAPRSISSKRSVRRKSSPQSISPSTKRKNFHAIEVYKYFGFHQTDAVVTDIGSGFVMNDYIMQKDL